MEWGSEEPAHQNGQITLFGVTPKSVIAPSVSDYPKLLGRRGGFLRHPNFPILGICLTHVATRYCDAGSRHNGNLNSGVMHGRSHPGVKNPAPDRKAVVERALECFRREYLEQHKIVELAEQVRERCEEMGLGLL
jgi:hypothetical protein